MSDDARPDDATDEMLAGRAAAGDRRAFAVLIDRHYDRIYRKIIAGVPLRDVSASFAMEQLKYTTELPLDFMILDKDASNAA